MIRIGFPSRVPATSNVSPEAPATVAGEKAFAASASSIGPSPTCSRHMFTTNGSRPCKFGSCAMLTVASPPVADGTTKFARFTDDASVSRQPSGNCHAICGSSLFSCAEWSCSAVSLACGTSFATT